MSTARVSKKKCKNRKCRVPLKDNERGHCKICKEIIKNTFRVAQRSKS